MNNVSNYEIGQLEDIVNQCLFRALQTHDALGKAGEEIIKKNQFGDTAVKADIECEKSILDFLKEIKLPIRVISEEHGEVEITENPQYLGVLDGLDGSGVYKKARGNGRYCTMFGIFSGIDPLFNDYLASGVIEQAEKRLYVAAHNCGAFITDGNKKASIHSSGETSLNRQTKIYIDEYFEINRRMYSDELKGFNTSNAHSSGICYADLASGAADLVLECTRKNNLEIAIAFGLETEAGAVMVGSDGKSIGDKKYFEFGQDKTIPIITASTQELAEKLLDRIKIGE